MYAVAYEGLTIELEVTDPPPPPPDVCPPPLDVVLVDDAPEVEPPPLAADLAVDLNGEFFHLTFTSSMLAVLDPMWIGMSSG